MTRPISAFLLTFCLFAVLSGAVLAADSPQVQVLNADRLYRQARGMKDVNALDKLLTPDFTAVNDGRPMTRAQFLAWTKKDGSAFRKWGPASQYSVQLHGSTAILSGQQSLTGRFEFIKGQETRELELTTRVTRVWVKTGDGWKCAHLIWHTMGHKPAR